MLPATISWLAALTVWPAPDGPDVHDRLADRVENVGGGVEVGRLAADHDRQRGRLRARLAAGHRGVEQPQPALRGLRRRARW